MLEVLSQVPQLLSKFVQRRFCRRATFDAHPVVTSHVILRF